ncbi:MAG: protein phosphatase 2C domain-containing protein [Ktedonobacteraceae bacterium]|nr:protein phosphatase 2C domain-containing protein [Ktedonobacteraceae bacterium]
MSMHGFISRNHRKSRLAASVFSLLSGFLVVLQLILLSSQPAHASSRMRTDTPLIGSSRAVDFAQVSVARLIATYQLPSGQATKPPSVTLAQCTGLGVMISSWTSEGGNDQNNWLMTDGSLVDPGQPSCLPTPPPSNLALLRVDLYFNKAFNPAMIPAFPVSPISVHCLLPICSSGPALLSFATASNQTFPHVDLANSNLTQDMALALHLQNAPGSIAFPPTPSNTNVQVSDQYVKEAQRYLTPQQEKPGDAKNPLEAGTPIFNSAGELTAIMLSNKTSLPVAGLASVINALPAIKGQTQTQLVNAIETLSTPQPLAPAPISPVHNNLVYENWKMGINSYYQGNYGAARTAFQKAENGNALFETPLAFEQLINSRLNKNGEGNTQTSSPITIKFPDKKMLIVLILSVLAVLLVLVLTLLIRARFLRRHRLLKDYAEADRRADLEAQRIKAMEEAQNQQNRQPVPSPAEAPAFSAARVRTTPLSRTATLPCPNCGAPVKPDDNFCSNCRMVLSPTESGYHMRAVKPQQPPAPLPSSRSLAEQPTLDMTPGLPSEQPTLEMPPTASDGQTDTERTVPYGFAAQPVKGQRLGIAVGTRSDPGIKRKYKPNEDSLFAAQWQREADAEPVPFGLFVVADGMGGHANGQDASRSAIQTIIDFMLPKLSKIVNPQSNDLEQLLANAVQHANLVVHQHNMEQRADMGTTVTTALIVEATAYISNVGDSRTYLYRPTDGLKKVTNDHSVVASLVEAGIIKPDDIYTHPKRNQIYRSLGEKSSVEVDSFVVHLQPGDKLLLCSDGLWDMVRDPKIEGVLKNTAPNPTMTADALIKAALEGGGEDNVSVIVISLTETPQHTVEHGIQLLAKPDAVQMPQL